MGPRAEAKAGPAPHGLLGALDHRPDLRTVRHIRERIEGRPHALKRVSHGLPDSPADLGQGVGKLGVLVIAHSCILPLAQTQSQGMFTTQLSRDSDTASKGTAAARPSPCQPGPPDRPEPVKRTRSPARYDTKPQLTTIGMAPGRLARPQL